MAGRTAEKGHVKLVVKLDEHGSVLDGVVNMGVRSTVRHIGVSK